MKRLPLTLLILIGCSVGAAQNPPGGGAPRGGGPPPPAGTRPAKAAAPIDFTGTWVSPVMESYRLRMVTPLKGDAAMIPYKVEARKVIDAWDPAKDEAAGEQCKAYGAPALMRIPGRVRISWQDDETLKIESDQGNQIRLLHFNDRTPGASASAGPPSWQGYSAAKWEAPQLPPVTGVAPGTSARWGARGDALEVTTSNLRAGYFRKNGLPYSDRTTVIEYFDRFSEPDGTEWFVVTTIVDDPVYLQGSYVTSTDYRREPDDSKFSPSPCSVL